MTTFFTQGLGSQHSGAPLAHRLRRLGFTVHDMDGMTRREIGALVLQEHARPAVLIATDHPLFTRGNFAKHVPESVPYYMSIADLSALREWDLVVYLEHDAVDEFQDRELPIGADYDLIALDRPRERPSLRPRAALTHRPHPLMPQVRLPADARWLFMPSFITVLREDIDAWMRIFPFLTRPDGVVKLPHDGGVEAVEAAMRAAGIRVIPSTTRVEELIGDYDGLVITADTSGIIADCAEFGAPVLVWLNADPDVQRAVARRFGAFTASTIEELDALLADMPVRRRPRRRPFATEWLLVRMALALTGRRLREWRARWESARVLGVPRSEVQRNRRKNLHAALSLVASGLPVTEPLTMVHGWPIGITPRAMRRVLRRPRAMPRLLSCVLVLPPGQPAPDWKALRSVGREYVLVHRHRAHVEPLFWQGFFHAEPEDEGARWWNGLAEADGEIRIVNRGDRTVTATLELTVSSPAGRQPAAFSLHPPGQEPLPVTDLSRPHTIRTSFTAPPGITTIGCTVRGGVPGAFGDPNAAVLLRVDDIALTTDHPCPHEHDPEYRTRQVWHHAGYETVTRVRPDGSLVEMSVAGTNEGHPLFQAHEFPPLPAWEEDDACGSWFLLAAPSSEIVEWTLGRRFTGPDTDGGDQGR